MRTCVTALPCAFASDYVLFTYLRDSHLRYSPPVRALMTTLREQCNDTTCLTLTALQYYINSLRFQHICPSYVTKTYICKKTVTDVMFIF